MHTLRISFDNLDDLLHRKTGNPMADDYLVPLLREVVERGGTVIVDLDGQEANLVLEKAATPKKKALGAVGVRSGGGGAKPRRRR